MPLRIDVVVPTRDGWALTERCLGCLRTQTIRHDVIVVDGGSRDETPSRIRASFPGVRLVELGANLGFSAACNRGAVEGDGDVVVLLNNDVEPRPDFLAELVRPLERGDRTGSSAALLVEPSGRRIDSVGLVVDRTFAGYPRLRGRPVDEAASPLPILAGPCGGGGAYRRAAWDEVGGLDEGVRFYGEDVDLALRLQSAGWMTAAAPAAVGVHLGSATAGRRSAWTRYQSGFARGYFLRRYGALSAATGARALATEAVVVVGDALLSRDFRSFRGRLAGWRAATGIEQKPAPPLEAIDMTITFLESLRLRRAIQAGCGDER